MNQYIFPLITDEIKKLPYYITSIGIQENQEHILRTEGHPHFHWIHTIRGKGILKIENKEYIISENMGFFISPNIPHEYYGVQEDWETHWITFLGYGIPNLLNVINLTHFKVFYIQDMHLLEEIFNESMTMLNTNSSLNSFESSVLLYKFLIMSKDCISSTNRTKITKQKQLYPVISFIENSYLENPTLEEMANIIQVTPNHLCRLFKEVFNMRPFSYLTKVRIQKAKELVITQEDIPIKDLAKRVGYHDVSYFCHQFKEYEGITPTEFRKYHRKD